MSCPERARLLDNKIRLFFKDHSVPTFLDNATFSTVGYRHRTIEAITEDDLRPARAHGLANLLRFSSVCSIKIQICSKVPRLPHRMTLSQR
jgi:hypothetical protein